MTLNVSRSKGEWVKLFSRIYNEDTEMEYECKYVTESEGRKFTIL